MPDPTPQIEIFIASLKVIGESVKALTKKVDNIIKPADFDHFDKNRDGWISPAEFTKLSTHVNDNYQKTIETMQKNNITTMLTMCGFLLLSLAASIFLMYQK